MFASLIATSLLQGIQWPQPGQVSFTETSWLTPADEGATSAAALRPPRRRRAALFGWPWFVDAPPEARRSARSSFSSNSASASLDGTEVWTVNLPLLGVLRTIEQLPPGVKALARNTLTSYLQQPGLADTVQGIFMKRCAALRLGLLGLPCLQTRAVRQHGHLSRDF